MSGAARRRGPAAACAAGFLLLPLAGLAAAGPPPRAAAGVAFPEDAGVVDVTKPPYNARGDGETDDTAALQRALDEHTGRGTILYLPDGVYLVSATLRLPFKNPAGNTNYGNTHLQGQSRARTVIRLKDGVFADPEKPAAVLDSGPHGSADWFHNSVRDLTIDTGRGNPGAVGLRFFSNNTGSVRDVVLRSGDGAGAVGLDLAYNDMNGPLLVQRVAVEGFAVGVAAGHTVNSQTFSHLRVQGQRVCGVRNEGQCLAIEGLVSVNAPSVPALVNSGGGVVALVGARLTAEGKGGAAPAGAAIENRADLYARDVRADGYREAVGGRPGTRIVEYASSPPVRLSPGAPPRGLGLPVREAPRVPWDPPSAWASPTRFGARPDQPGDAAPAIQAAIDSGATTVYLPKGAWRIASPVRLRGRVRRLIGCESWLVPAEPLRGRAEPLFRVEEGAGPVVIERLSADFSAGPFFFVEQASSRPLTLSGVAVNFQGATDTLRGAGTGDVFLEDVVGGPFRFSGQSVWARQLNQETEGTHVANAGGSLWVLGLKTERGGTLVETTAGGRTEVLGGLSYTTTAGKLAPMFVVDGDRSAASVTLGERCYSGDPYAVIVRERRGGAIRELPASDPAYRGRLVLYAGAPAAPPSRGRR